MHLNFQLKLCVQLKNFQISTLIFLYMHIVCLNKARVTAPCSISSPYRKEMWIYEAFDIKNVNFLIMIEQMTIYLLISINVIYFDIISVYFVYFFFHFSLLNLLYIYLSNLTLEIFFCYASERKKKDKRWTFCEKKKTTHFFF